MAISTITIQDLIPIILNKSNSKKLDTDTVLPFILLPGLLLVATYSLIVTIIVMVAIIMGVLYVVSRPRQKNRSPFFFSWTIASGSYMFLVFEFGVRGLLEITQLENLLFVTLYGCTVYFFFKMKRTADFELATGSSKGKEYSPVITADCKYCQICQLEVKDSYFHSIWWDCCVLRPNYPYFLAAQLCAFFTILVGTNLTLTTICHPYIFIGNILMPEDCSDVYFDLTLAMCFVSCVYSLGYLVVVLLILFNQLFIYIPKYTEPQWRRIFNVLNV